MLLSAYDNAQEAFTARYNHETVAMGFSITEEAMEDNLYDSLSSRYTKALARAMAYTKQVKAAAFAEHRLRHLYSLVTASHCSALHTPQYRVLQTATVQR